MVVRTKYVNVHGMLRQVGINVSGDDDDVRVIITTLYTGTLPPVHMYISSRGQDSD